MAKIIGKKTVVFLPIVENGAAEIMNNPIKVQQTMQEKINYVSPECETLEMRLEGVIAASGDPQIYNNPFGDEELTF